MKFSISLFLFIGIFIFASEGHYFKNGGCYEAYHHKSPVRTIQPFTLERTMAECSEENFIIFMGNGSFFCDVDPPPIHKLRSGAQCDLPCDGESGSEMCGGHNHFVVHKNIQDAGCYEYEYNGTHTETTGMELINVSTITETKNNTVESCIKRCLKNNYIYAGVAVGKYCACAIQPPPISLLKPYGECQESCTGDPTENCGGYQKFANRSEVRRSNVYQTYEQDEGCFHIQLDNWILNEQKTKSQNNSIVDCRKNCSQMGYKYAGVTGGCWCACGHNPPSIGDLRPNEQCNLPCSGDESSSCGGSGTMQIANTLQVGGCYRNISGAKLKRSYVNNSINSCIKKCKEGNYSFTSVKNGSICICNDIPPKLTDLLPYENCSKSCSGDANQTCGDIEHMNIFRSKIQVCKTNGGLKANVPCVFPFIFKGKTYHSCTEHQSEDSVPWCGVEYNVTKHNWGFCNLALCTVDKRVKNSPVEKMVKNSTLRIVIHSISACAIVAFLIALIICCKFKKIQIKYRESKRKNIEIRKLLEGDNSRINRDLPLKEQTNLISYNMKYDISEDTFTTEQMIGDGQFGAVFLGTLYDKELNTKVAIKEVKDVTDNNQMHIIIGELKILSMLKVHMNLVNLIAASTNNGIHILLEYCQYGDMKNFLMERKKNFLNQNGSESEYDTILLLKWSHSIAKGMEYLSSENIMHGDLAARNILLGEKMVAKISDFGLSKNIFEGKEYKKIKRRMIPWAWMALEYLQTGKFNIKSDVWSFGVVLWEIYSLGDKPYANESYENVKQRLLNGYKLPAPEYMGILDKHQNIYTDIMINCWERNLTARPDFVKVANTLEVMLGDSGIQEYNKMEQEMMQDPVIKRMNNLTTTPWQKVSMKRRNTRKFSFSKRMENRLKYPDIKKTVPEYSDIQDTKKEQQSGNQSTQTYINELKNTDKQTHKCIVNNRKLSKENNSMINKRRNTWSGGSQSFPFDNKIIRDEQDGNI